MHVPLKRKKRTDKQKWLDAEIRQKISVSVFTSSDGEPPTKDPINSNESLTDIDVKEERVKTLTDGPINFESDGERRILGVGDCGKQRPSRLCLRRNIV